MTGYEQHPQSQHYVAGSQVQLQSGVRQFMNGVYAWMAAGIGVTGVTSYFVSQSPAMLKTLYMGPMAYVTMFAPLVLAWILPGRIPRMSAGGAVAAFMLFAGALGLALGYIPLMYQTQSILQILLATVGMFAGMAALGYVTKKDLTGMGQFLAMALIGAIIASLINVFFVHSFGMSTVISAIVAAVAAGLTAYHTQAVKQIYLVNGGRGNLAIIGALALYVDFINLFLSLLRLFGSRE